MVHILFNLLLRVYVYYDLYWNVNIFSQNVVYMLKLEIKYVDIACICTNSTFFLLIY